MLLLLQLRIVPEEYSKLKHDVGHKVLFGNRLFNGNFTGMLDNFTYSDVERKDNVVQNLSSQRAGTMHNTLCISLSKHTLGIYYVSGPDVVTGRWE